MLWHHNNNNNNHHTSTPLELLLCCSSMAILAPSHVISHSQPQLNEYQLVIISTITQKECADVAPCVLVQMGQTVTTFHSLITLCPLSLFWSNPCLPSVVDTALWLHSLGTGATSLILTITDTPACTKPHTHNHLHSYSHSHSHTNDHAKACGVLSPTLMCTHQIKCHLDDSHMHLHAQHSHSIVFAFACLSQESQSTMCHLRVGTSVLALVSDTGLIVTFIPTSMSHNWRRSRLDWGCHWCLVVLVIFSIYYFFWLFSLLHSYLLTFTCYGEWYDCSAYMVWTTTLQTPQYRLKCKEEGNLSLALKMGRMSVKYNDRGLENGQKMMFK